MNNKKFESTVIDILDEYERYFDHFEYSLRKHYNDSNLNPFNPRDPQASESKLTALTLPSASMSRLVLIMIRHTILVICYDLFWVSRSLIHRILANSSKQSNIFEILSNLTIYMLYPVGDSAYQYFCLLATDKIFSKWYKRYVHERTVRIDNLTEREKNASSKSVSSKGLQARSNKLSFTDDQRNIDCSPGSSIIFEFSSNSQQHSHTSSKSSMSAVDKLLADATLKMNQATDIQICHEEEHNKL